MYDYKSTIRRDLVNAMNEEEDIIGMEGDELRQYLNDRFFNDDCVTGNGSGSYTCSRYRAKDHIINDDDSFVYLADAEAEGFITEEQLGHWILEGNWEAIDVTIRCFLLPQVIDDLIDKEWF